MVLRKVFEIGNEVVITLIKAGVEVELSYDKELRQVIRSAEIRKRKGDHNLNETTIIRGEKATIKDFEEHLKKATNYFLKSNSTDYVVVNKHDINKLTTVDERFL